MEFLPRQSDLILCGKTVVSNSMKTPWHLWLIGGLMLLWNGMGAVDYVLTVSRNEGYLAQFTPERLAFLEKFPAWATASWALSVWLFVAGSICLLLRSRQAVRLLFAGLGFMIVTSIHNLFIAEVSALETMSAGEVVFTIVIFVLAILQGFYARSLARRGVLR